MNEEAENKENIIEMRPDEFQDPEKVGAFLEGKIPGAKGAPKILQFGGGKANLTYLLQYPGFEYVLRRPPLGPVAPKSHDMGREHKVLSVLYKAFSLAPRAFLFSEDESVVGAPFVVMERREGMVIRTEMPEKFANRPDLYRALSENMVDALADLHKVDYQAIGLEKLGRAEGYLERQVKGWLARWEAAKTEEVEGLGELVKWLEENIPPAQAATLVHNDYKLDNMMVEEEDPSHLVGIFDWDMCTLGDPLTDAGALLGYWVEKGDSEARQSFRSMPTILDGFFSREEIITRYAERTGFDVSQIGYYEVFSLFKLAVIVQQIYVRWFRGQTKDERFKDYGPRAINLIHSALETRDRL